MWRCASRRVQLRPSYQTDLKGASAPVWPRRAEDSVTHYRIGQSFTVMLEAPLIVRVVVPATPAHPGGRGRRDAFGQYGTVRSGLLAGALLMEEAGGHAHWPFVGTLCVSPATTSMPPCGEKPKVLPRFARLTPALAGSETRHDGVKPGEQRFP